MREEASQCIRALVIKYKTYFGTKEYQRQLACASELIGRFGADAVLYAIDQGPQALERPSLYYHKAMLADGKFLKKFRDYTEKLQASRTIHARIEAADRVREEELSVANCSVRGAQLEARPRSTSDWREIANQEEINLF